MRRTIKVNNEVLKQMKKIYYEKGKLYLDWMGFKITDENKPSYHHIIKAETLRNSNESDIATLENGAYLGKKSHELLHRIEENNNELYIAWNKLFELINKNKKYPDQNMWYMIFRLQEESLKFIEEKSLK